MKEYKYTICDDAGIHARPAGLFVKEAEKFNSNIKIKAGDKEADGKRLFSIMSLGVKKGDEVTIVASGDDENNAIVALSEFLKKSL